MSERYESSNLHQQWFLYFHQESSPFVARLIGIGKYEKYADLKPKGDTNAENLRKFLEEDFLDRTLDNDIKMLSSESDTTKDKIIETFNELRNSIDRNKAILFFFSGFGGSKGAGRPSIICPADIEVDDKSKGIIDQEIIELFDSTPTSME